MGLAPQGRPEDGGPGSALACREACCYPAEPAELTQKQIFEYLRHILIRNFDTQKTH